MTATIPAIPGVQHADIQLPTGLRMHYAEAGNPSGPTIVMLHGYSDSWFSYSQVFPMLAATHHLIALDQRGHGDSDRPAHGYAMTDFAADVLAFLDARNLARVTLVGHSMGTLIAQQVALMAPERLERLVLVGATACLRAVVDELEQAVAALQDPVPPGFAREFQLSTTYRSLPGEFLDQVVAESMKLPARVWQAVMAGMLAVDYSDQLSSIRVPTLIVWGDQDTIFDRAHQDALLAGLPDASLKTYPATGHALHWERPAQFARDLAAFAKGV